MLLWGRVEKTNKSELWNRLTYRVLIYIFEVGMKTFFFKWEISRSKSQFEKNGLFFLRLEAELFLSPCYHARHLQQIRWFKIFCSTYGLAVMLTITTLSPMSLINKILKSKENSKYRKEKLGQNKSIKSQNWMFGQKWK